MKFELEKGTFGYIKKNKRRQMGLVILMFVIAVAMFITGLIVNKNDKANLLTALAILMVLPAAKFLTLYIVMFPYKSVSKERYEKVKAKVNDNIIVMTDMVITSTQRSMNLDFILITDNQVLCLLGKAKQDVKYIEGYLAKTLSTSRADSFTVKVFTDEKKFMECIPERDFEKSSLQEEAYRVIRTLVV